MEQAQAQLQTPTPKPKPKHPFLLIVSVMLATIMFAVDTTIANIALPQIQGSLQASQDQLAWVLTSYILTSAIVTPLLSHVVDRFSIARVLVVSISFFTLSSVLCGLATNMTEMVLFRMLQGMSGAALVPLSQSILLTNFARDKHVKVLAIWAVGSMIGPIVGPSLGGYLTDEFSWRWIFLINVPVGILAVLGVAYTVPRDKPGSQKPFDMLGYILIAVAIAALQLCLDRGSSKDWFESLEITIEAFIAVLFLYMFVIHSRTTKHPFFSTAIFRDRNFVLGTFLICIVLVGTYAAMVLLPLFLQQLQGYPVMQAGFLMVPRGVGLLIVTVFMGTLSKFFQPKYIAFAGMLLISWSLQIMSEFNLYVDQYSVGMSGFIQGAGIGLVTVPLMSSAFSTLRNELRTEATVVYALFRNIGSSLGISFAMNLLSRSNITEKAQLVEHVSVFDFDKLQFLATNFGDKAYYVLAMEVERQAAMMAYINDFTVQFFLSLCALPLIWLIRSDRL